MPLVSIPMPPLVSLPMSKTTSTVRVPCRAGSLFRSPNLPRRSILNSCCLRRRTRLPCSCRSASCARQADVLRIQRPTVQASTSTNSTVTNSTNSTETKQASSLVLPQHRRLILLRHAKSSWDDPSLRDHDRPLNSRGRKAAQQIAQRLAEEGWLPDLILCSDATRTKETLHHMVQAVPVLGEIEARFLPSFYSVAAMDGQTAVHLQGMVARCAGSGVGTVLCMGHNKGWEEAASEFSREEVELRTAHGALLQSELEHSDWATAFAHGGWLLHKVIKPDTH